MNKQIALENLITISSILEKHKVKYWLTDGTLLGLYRENDFIGHDTDTDIGIDFNSFNKNCLYDLQIEFRIKHIFGYIEDSFEITLEKDGIKTDLFFFYERGDKYYHCAFSEWRGSYYKRIDYEYDKFELENHNFLNHEFPIPKDPLEFILTKYGENWKTPDKNWRYDYSPKNHIKTNIWIDNDLSKIKFENWLKN